MDGDFRLESWLVQPKLNTVSCEGTTNRLEPKVMEVLVCLVSHAGEPVAKVQLLQAVWPDTAVSDDVLSRSIFELRRVFDDDAKQSRVIQTIPKRGYRLVAPVEPVNGRAVSPGSLALSTGATTVAAESPTLPVRRSRALRLDVLTGLSGALVVVALFGIFLAKNRREVSAKTGVPQIRSIAVLPLKNLSGHPEQKYFAAGMTEELITDLRQSQNLQGGADDRMTRLLEPS